MVLEDKSHCSLITRYPGISLEKVCITSFSIEAKAIITSDNSSRRFQESALVWSENST